MRLKAATIAFALTGVLVISAMPTAEAQQRQRVVTTNRGNTVYVSRDENGRTRTRIIVQKRSYLDPGTERFPGERNNVDYAWNPNHRAIGVLDNTVFGGNQTALPNNWTLPGKNNPFIGY